MRICNILHFEFRRGGGKTRPVTPARTNTQKLITLHVDAALFDATEKCRGRVSRSQWLRDAILEKLKREGLELPEEAAFAPDRSGKGGPKPKEEPQVLQMPMARVAEDDGTPACPEGPMKQVKYPKKR